MRGVDDRRHRCCGPSHDSGKCARERGRTAKIRFAERGRGLCGHVWVGKGGGGEFSWFTLSHTRHLAW